VLADALNPSELKLLAGMIRLNQSFGLTVRTSIMEDIPVMLAVPQALVFRSDEINSLPIYSPYHERRNQGRGDLEL